MDVLVRLYNMVEPASDGSVISRAVTEEYLASEDYKIVIRDRLAIGGKTHKDRVVGEDNRSVIGPDDEVLVNKNSLFYIKKIFTTPDSDYAWAIITFYDPDNFSGELREEIINLMGLIKEGTKLPCSVVIQAVWGMDNKCTKIIRIKGLDFTLNPSFAGAGIEKLMSATVVSTETKMFSEGKPLVDKKFSFQSELKSSLTRKEILCLYGKNSEEYKQFSLKRAIDKNIEKKKGLAQTLTELNASDSSLSLEQFLNILSEFVNDQNKQLFRVIYREGIGPLTQIVKSVPKTDPNYEELVKIRLVNYLSAYPQYDKLFSINTIVEDRMKLTNYPIMIRLRYLIRIYQFYLKGTEVKEDELRDLQELFVLDITALVRELLDRVLKGESISSILQLSSLSPELSEKGRELSFYYRRLLIADKVLGYIPPQVLTIWSNKFSEFLSAFLVFVFGKSVINTNKSFLR